MKWRKRNCEKKYRQEQKSTGYMCAWGMWVLSHQKDRGLPSPGISRRLINADLAFSWSAVHIDRTCHLTKSPLKKTPKTLLWLKCRSFCSYFESSNISQMAMLLQFMEGSCHHSLQTFLPQEFQADTLSSHKNIIKYYSTLNKRKLVKESFDAWCVYVNLLNGEIIQHS